MKLKVDLNLDGGQTAAHCSETSSINICEKLDCGHERCKLFNRILEYDWNYHAYKRCEKCKESEVK